MEEIVIYIFFFYEYSFNIYSIFIQLCCEEIGIMKTLFANTNFKRICDGFFSSHACFCYFLEENTLREQKILIIKASNFRSEKMLQLF